MDIVIMFSLLNTLKLVRIQLEIWREVGRGALSHVQSYAVPVLFGPMNSLLWLCLMFVCCFLALDPVDVIM